MKKIISLMMFLGVILVMTDSVSAQYCPNPQEEPAAEQVFIYVDENFLGSCNKLTYTGRDTKYPYSIEAKYDEKKWFNLGKDSFFSIKIGAGVVVTVCSGKNFSGKCEKFTESVPNLGAHGFRKGQINSFKIYTLTPKQRTDIMTPNDNQVLVCTARTYGGGCLLLHVGNHDFRGLVYRYIHVGQNAKVQTYDERNFYGNFEVYQGGAKQASNGQILSIRVMRSSDELVAVKVRPTPAPLPVSTPSPTVDNSPVGQANREKVYILNTSGTKCLTVKDGKAEEFNPVILAECTNSDSQQWAFTSDGKIRGLANMCITDDMGLTLRTCRPDASQDWLVSDKNEIKRAWACLSQAKLKNGSPGVTGCNGSSEQRWRFENNVAVTTTSPTGPGPVSTVNTSTNTSTPKNPIDGPVRVVGKTVLGLTVQNQQIQNNSNIILHPGFNNWVMLSNGAIVLKNNPQFGLTVKNQRITNGSEIILHRGYNLWTVLSNGAIVLKENPSFGLTVLNQNLNENAKIILHGGYNTWTKDHTGSSNVAADNPPPKANHYPPPNSGGSPYVLCGYQNQYCSFQGTGTVAYGVNGIFKYKRNVSRGIQCDDATFGFVVKDVEKRCYFKFERNIVRNTTPTETDKPSPPNSNFRVCGVEGGTCNFRGTRRVAYGYNDKNGRRFLFKSNVNGNIACDNRTFGGDPAPGKPKTCYVEN